MKGKLRCAALLFALLTLGIFLALPSLAETKVPYTKATLNKTSASISPAGTVRLKLAKFAPSNANDAEWVSSNTDVCTVDDNGLVTPNANLTKTSSATVSFVSDGKTLAKCKITVKVVAVKSVKLSKTSMAISPGRTGKLTATVSPSNAAHRQITWTSSDPSIVDVDEEGNITPVGLGSATVTASTANGKNAKCKIKVAYVQVSKVAIKKSTLSMGPGQVAALTYEVTPEYAKDTSLTWTSSKESVVTVEDGVVTAHADGTATVTAVSNDGSKKKDTIKITVKAIRVKTFKLTKEYDTYIKKGDSFKMATEVTPSNASFKVPEWMSSDESVLTVDEGGNVKAIGGGVATITGSVDYGRKKVSRKFYVCEGNGVTIKISAAGDVTLGGDPRKSKDDYKVVTQSTAARFKELLEEHGNNPGFVFENVKSVFEKDDLSIVNLEGPLTSSTSYSMSKKYVFRGHPSYAAALSYGSIEAVSIANNQAPCCGAKGIADTKAAIEQYTQGKTVWFDDTPVGSEPCLIEKKGVTIGLIGFTQATKDAIIQSRIGRIRSQCDLLIVYIHFTNVDHTHKTTATMKQTAHTAVNAGADLVLGAHQHCLAGIELYNGKTICYGLGNFVHGGSADRDTVIYQQTFEVYDGFSFPKAYNVVACATTDDVTVSNKWQPILLTDKAEIAALKERLHSYSKGYTTPGI